MANLVSKTDKEELHVLYEAKEKCLLQSIRVGGFALPIGGMPIALQPGMKIMVNLEVLKYVEETT